MRHHRPTTNDAPDASRSDDRPRAGQAERSGSPPPRWSRLVLPVVWLLFLGGFIALVATANPSTSKPPETLQYSAFLSKVAANDVRSVDINQTSGVIDGALRDGRSFQAQGPTGGLPTADMALLDEHHVARNYQAPTTDIWPTVLEWVVPIALIALMWVWMGRRMRGQMSGLTGGLTGWSHSGAKVHVTDESRTTFADIAGYDAVKVEISELVDFLKEPTRFREIGARIPKGVLLVGPPGTGKTLFARAVAGEAGVSFLSITGSEFMEMFVGVGAARVRDLFRKARESAPSIVFIDEIDAIGRKRGTGIGGGHDEREQTLNQILSEMDGFEATEGVIVMAATNRPDVLDPALLRAGRFDRQVVVPLPALDERKAILRVHCRGKRLATDVNLDTVAQATPGMSGADLANLVNEAALIAVRHASTEISRTDLDQASDRLQLGLRRSSLVLSPEEKRIVAYHESGHALLAELLPHADPVHKVTILPSGMALGATQQLPAEEHQLMQLPMLEDTLAVRLGGRAAEELVFGLPSTGAQDDLVSATELAGHMVRQWGMSKALGEMAFGSQGPVFLGEDLVHTRDYSDETARVIDQEISRILEQQAVRAQQTLADHRPALDALASALMRAETLQGADLRDVIAAVDRPPEVSVTTATGGTGPPDRQAAGSVQGRSRSVAGHRGRRPQDLGTRQETGKPEHPRPAANARNPTAGGSRGGI